MDADRENPKRAERLIINNDDEQAPVLLNPMTGQMLITNSVGKRIVELADGTRDLETIATLIVTEFRGSPEISEVRQRTEAFLSEGERKGIVTWTNRS